MRISTERIGVPHVAAQLGDRRDISGLLGIGVQGEVLGHLPDADFAVVRGRGNERVVEGRPARG